MVSTCDAVKAGFVCPHGEGCSRPGMAKQLTRSPSKSLSISLLGRLRLSVDGEPFRFVARHKAVHLLAYLLLHRANPSSRSALAFQLWPDESEETARSNLRRHLYILRAALPASDDPWVLVDGDSVQWNPTAGATIDVADFERLAAASDPRGVELYAGDLLEQHYDDWLIPHREHLRGLYLELLLKVATAARERRDPATAEQLLQRMLAADPLREDALRALMSVRYEQGDRSGALSVFDDFGRRLASELGVDPMPETAALHEEILHNVPLPELPIPNNLPHPASRLIGRDEDIAQLAELLQVNRLVTVVGAGGVGKTRAALRVAETLLLRFPDGVWFAELAPIGDPSRVTESLAAAIGVVESHDRPILDSLLDYLKRRRLLIVIDNCEHVIAEVARAAEMILHRASEARLLVTSRERLHISDEVAYRLPSLSYPAPDDEVTAASAPRFGAVALFADRAKATDPGFRLSDETAPIVGEICRRLDGIPLAIELAAVRVNALDVASLARRLDERFGILTSGSRTALPRHRTLRALIDWTHQLLSEPERRLFRRVATFSGGWTIEAAEAVCTDAQDVRNAIVPAANESGAALEAVDVLDVLTSLVEKSLIVAESEGRITRYRLLESTRAYALERLSESGERELLARRHAEWMAAFADHAYDVLWMTPLDRWLADVEPELENARTAMRWSLDAVGEATLAGRIAAGFGALWGGFQGEGRRWIEASLATLGTDAPTAIEARLWRELAHLSFADQTIEAATRSITLFERLDDRAGLAVGNFQLAFGLLGVRRVEEAESACERALGLYREIHQERTRRYGNALKLRANIARALGRFDEDRFMLVEALDIYATLGEEGEAASTAGQLAELEFAVGNTAAALVRVHQAVQAIERASQASTRSSRLRDSLKKAIMLCNAAAYRLALGEVDEAYAAARDALGLALRCQDSLTASFALQHLATVYALRGDPRRAARLLGYVDAWYRNAGYAREFTEQRIYDIAMASLRAQLTEDEIATFARYGAQLCEDEAVAVAVAVTIDIAETGRISTAPS
jgi:predicted ATPase/DNA-binding SARP family transcriptional activator